MSKNKMAPGTASLSLVYTKTSNEDGSENKIVVKPSKKGAMAGAMAGAALGTAVPVLGTAIGALIGGTIGLVFGEDD